MNKKVFIIDLFCGAGGTTTGATMAHDNIKVIACVNHDQNAIASHNENHPETIHFIEDIRVLAMIKLRKIVKEIKKEHPDALIYLWASLECTNYSKAKGGLPRDGDSRTLANHLFRYIEALNPDKIWIENVTEFMIWGPIDENGKPIQELKGVDFKKWKDTVQRYGYNYEHKVLNAADYGAYTSRRRYFAQFTRWGSKAAWPAPTHGKSQGLKPYRPVKEVLDFNNEGRSIFTRKKPLAEATLTRIYHGLVKFVANGEGTFIKRYNGGDPKEKSKSINNPIGTIATSGRFAIVKSCFLAKYYGNGKNIESINGSCGTVTTKDRFQFIQAQYGQSKANSVDAPCGTITANPKQNLVSGTFLMNPQFNSKGASIENPCFTLIARMDKAPPYLVTTENGVPKHKPLQGGMMPKIVDFMVEHGIADIKMRMLEIEELLKIQGFPEGYKLIGTKTQQKKYIGNAVECNQAKALLEADYKSL